MDPRIKCGKAPSFFVSKKKGHIHHLPGGIPEGEMIKLSLDFTRSSWLENGPGPGLSRCISVFPIKNGEYSIPAMLVYQRVSDFYWLSFWEKTLKERLQYIPKDVDIFKPRNKHRKREHVFQKKDNNV